MTCPLCIREPRTHCYHEDDLVWVVDCSSCGTPMIVWKSHTDQLFPAENQHVCQVLQDLFGHFETDGIRRTHPEHWHAHLRGEEGISCNPERDEPYEESLEEARHMASREAAEEEVQPAPILALAYPGRRKKKKRRFVPRPVRGKSLQRRRGSGGWSKRRRGPSANPGWDVLVMAIHPYEEGHLKEVMKDMERLGAPTIRVASYQDAYMALEGVHRLEAARRLKLVPELVELELDELFDHDLIDLLAQGGRTAGDVVEYIGVPAGEIYRYPDDFEPQDNPSLRARLEDEMLTAGAAAGAAYEAGDFATAEQEDARYAELQDNPWYIERMSKAEMLADATADHEEEIVKSRMAKSGHHTMRYWLADGREILRYVRTDVVVLWPDGGIQLRNGGFRTPTTASRINSELARVAQERDVTLPEVWQLPSPRGEGRFKGRWMIGSVPVWHPVEFVDGMMLYEDGLMLIPDSDPMLFGIPQADLTDEQLVTMDWLLEQHQFWVAPNPGKDLKKLMKMARRQGWRVERTGGGHHKFCPPDISIPCIVVSDTPSDQRALRKQKRDLRRAGLQMNPLDPEAWASEHQPCAMARPVHGLTPDDRSGVHFALDWGLAARYALFKASRSSSIGIVLTYDLTGLPLEPDYDAEVEKDHGDSWVGEVNYYIEEFDILEDHDEPDYDRLASLMEGEADSFQPDAEEPPYSVEAALIENAKGSIFMLLADKLIDPMTQDEALAAIKSADVPLEWWAEAIGQMRTFSVVGDERLLRVQALKPVMNEIATGEESDEAFGDHLCPAFLSLEDLDFNLGDTLERMAVTLWERPDADRVRDPYFHGTDLTRAEVILADAPAGDLLRNPWDPCTQP